MAAFRHQWSLPPHVLFSKYSSTEYDRLVGDGHPLQFRRSGYLFLFTGEEKMATAARRVEVQRGLGVEGVRVLSDADLRAEVACGPSLAEGGIVGATWGPRDGFLDPLAAAQAYLTEARAGGVTYRHDLAATEILTSDGRVSGLRLSDSETVEAPAVLLATGVWGRPLLRHIGLDLPVRPAKRYLYNTRPIRGLDVSDWPMVIAESGAHCRPSEGNTLTLGWEDRPPPLSGDQSGDALWEMQDQVEPGFAPVGEGYGVEMMLELAPLLPFFTEGVGLAGVTCGYYAVTPDHKAILGEDPRLAGLYHATGFSGHGIMHGPATGRILADLILDAADPLLPPAEVEAAFGPGPLLDRGYRDPAEDMVL